MVPDPAGLAAVDITNPQTWNRYAYVANNPLNAIDPLGLYLCIIDGVETDHGCPGASGAPGAGGGIPIYTTGTCQSSTPGPDGGAAGSTTTYYACPVLSGYWYGSGNGAGGGAANSGRNCTASPATAGQYVAATAQVAAMTAEFFSGFGPGNLTFGPNSATSQVMAQSGPVQNVLNSYSQTGQTSGLYTFGLPGLASAGGNPVAQFVGSFRWSITPVSSGINLSITNTTSFRSLTYDVGPQWQRGSFPTPMGNTHQTYNITAKCQ